MKLREVEKLWELVPNNESINIYINTPFCYCHCRYCLYQGNKYNEETVKNYVEYYLLPDIEATLPALRNRKIDTIYFGGGTPNCLSIELLKKIVGALGDRFTSAKARIIEINPSFVSDEFLEAVAQIGFSLVTLGVQTYDIESLIKIKRTPVSYERICKIITKLKNGGVKYVSLDIMAYLQTYRESDLYDYLRNDLELSFNSGADFVTVYPELNLINIDKKLDSKFREYILNISDDRFFMEKPDFPNNPRSIVRYISNRYSYEEFLDKILPYYEEDFPYAKMNILGIGDYRSKQEVISYSPQRFAYVEEYKLDGPQYRLLYVNPKNNEGSNMI